MMSEQAIELLVVKIELMSTTLLHCVIQNIARSKWDNQFSLRNCCAPLHESAQNTMCTRGNPE